MGNAKKTQFRETRGGNAKLGNAVTRTPSKAQHHSLPTYQYSE